MSAVNRLQNDSDGKFVDRAAAKHSAEGTPEGMTNGPKCEEGLTFVLKEYKFKGENGEGWRLSRLESHRSDSSEWEESLRIEFVCNFRSRRECV